MPLIQSKKKNVFVKKQNLLLFIMKVAKMRDYLLEKNLLYWFFEEKKLICYNAPLLSQRHNFINENTRKCTDESWNNIGNKSWPVGQHHTLNPTSVVYGHYFKLIFTITSPIFQQTIQRQEELDVKLNCWPYKPKNLSTR